MDPRLFDAVWEAYRGAGATQRITVLCGYRSPETNAMLRRRSRAVAEHSQHILGKAMDTTMHGMSMERVRESAARLQMGGVGYYGDTNFVHIDVGGVRDVAAHDLCAAHAAVPRRQDSPYRGGRTDASGL